MRVVLYANDMEPITVLELEGWAVEMLSERQTVRFAVSPPAAVKFMTPEGSPSQFMREWIVEVWAETFVRHGLRHLMLFTKDETSALLLKSAFLPGQMRSLNEQKQEAFAQGMLRGLYSALR